MCPEQEVQFSSSPPLRVGETEMLIAVRQAKAKGLGLRRDWSFLSICIA